MFIFEWVFVLYLFVNGQNVDQVVFEMGSEVVCEAVRDSLRDSTITDAGVTVVIGPCHKKRDA